MRESKTKSVLDLLGTPGGATLAALMKATGWQAHSVRGFLSQKVSKQLGLPLQSVRLDGQRVYALISQDQENRLRTHRSLTPIFSAASRWLITLSRVRFSHSNLSRSSWLIPIRSTPSALRLSIGTFYFGQLGTSHFGATG